MKKIIAVMLALTFMLSGFASTAYASGLSRQTDANEARSEIYGYINATNINLRTGPYIRFFFRAALAGGQSGKIGWRSLP